MPEDFFPQALDAIGGEHFAPKLLAHLAVGVRAQHCVLYRFGSDDLEVVGAASADGTDMAGRNSARYRRDFWRRDTVFQALRGRLSGYRSELGCVAAERVRDAEFRHHLFDTQRLSGRAMLLGERDGALYGISLFRASDLGFFQERERELIRQSGDTLISCVAKHHGVLLRAAAADALLSSVRQLEAGFAAMPALSAREGQICARVLWGLSMKETARELGISAESCETYRKRAYLRLGVGSRAELMRAVLKAR